MLRVYAIALVLAVTAVACASTSRAGMTTPDATEEAAPRDAPAVTRYKLDATPVAQHTFQGTLAVHGDTATLELDRRARTEVVTVDSSPETLTYTGTIERGDVTTLAFTDSTNARVCELACADDGFGMSCTPHDARSVFGTGPMPLLRFERLSLRVNSF